MKLIEKWKENNSSDGQETVLFFDILLEEVEFEIKELFDPIWTKRIRKILSAFIPKSIKFLYDVIYEIDQFTIGMINRGIKRYEDLSREESLEIEGLRMYFEYFFSRLQKLLKVGYVSSPNYVEARLLLEENLEMLKVFFESSIDLSIPTDEEIKETDTIISSFGLLSFWDEIKKAEKTPDCPSKQELMDYALGTKGYEYIESHVVKCNFCFRETIDMSEALL